MFNTQTAILKFKCGVPNWGRSLFKNMLREYPKRTDLWSVYLDQVSLKSKLQTMSKENLLSLFVFLFWLYMPQNLISYEQEIRLG